MQPKANHRETCKGVGNEKRRGAPDDRRMSTPEQGEPRPERTALNLAPRKSLTNRQNSPQRRREAESRTGRRRRRQELVRFQSNGAIALTLAGEDFETQRHGGNRENWSHAEAQSPQRKTDILNSASFAPLRETSFRPTFVRVKASLSNTVNHCLLLCSLRASGFQILHSSTFRRTLAGNRQKDLRSPASQTLPASAAQIQCHWHPASALPRRAGQFVNSTSGVGRTRPDRHRWNVFVFIPQGLDRRAQGRAAQPCVRVPLRMSVP